MKERQRLRGLGFGGGNAWREKLISLVIWRSGKGTLKKSALAGNRRKTQSVAPVATCRLCGVQKQRASSGQTRGTHPPTHLFETERLLRRSCYLMKPRVARVCEGYPGNCANNQTTSKRLPHHASQNLRQPFQGCFFFLTKPKVALADSGNHWAIGGNAFAVVKYSLVKMCEG